MQQFKNKLNDLQLDIMRILEETSEMIRSNSSSDGVLEKRMDIFLSNVENLCIKSRTALEQYRPVKSWQPETTVNEIVNNISGSIEVTSEGWIHITLNTLLPSCKHRISNYIGDTVGRLLYYYGSELPFFETAFLAIVEYCNYDNRRSLDSDNKGWKMIPNALKGRAIEDDNQFVLSVGLFSKLSDTPRCEIYLMPPEDSSLFMEILHSEG